jgi:hypothetical protein
MVPSFRGPIVGIFATVAEFETSFAFMGITATVCAKILVLVFRRTAPAEVYRSASDKNGSEGKD